MAVKKTIKYVRIVNQKTLKQLSAKYGRSIPWIMKRRYEYIVECKVYNPRPVNLICDATFYDKRGLYKA